VSLHCVIASFNNIVWEADHRCAAVVEQDAATDACYLSLCIPADVSSRLEGSAQVPAAAAARFQDA